MARTINAGRAGGSIPGAGAQGTLGGMKQAVGARPGKRAVVMGDEAYLWILVLTEVALVFYGRSVFSRYHGG